MAVDIYSLFPSKLRPGGFQGQEEALRPPRRRQLFVFASDHSFTGIEQMPVAQPQNTREKPRKSVQMPREFQRWPVSIPRAREKQILGPHHSSPESWCGPKLERVEP